MDFNYHNNNFVYFYARLRKTYRDYTSKVLSKHGFTQSEIDVLTFLKNNSPRFNTASDITKYKGVSKGLVSKTVHSLVSKGLIETKANEKDKRVINLFLTPESATYLKDLDRANNLFYTSLFKDVEGDDLKVFHKVNKKLLDNLNVFISKEE